MKKVTRLARMLVVLSTILISSGLWAQTTLLNESFNGGVMPTGWTQTIVSGTTNWVFNAVGNNGTQPATTHSGAYNALFKYAGHGAKNDLVTPVINFTGFPLGTLSFWHVNASWGGDQDSLTVYYRINSTDTWKKIGQYKTSVTTWTQESITLPNPTATYQIKFGGCAEYGYGLCLDDVLVQGMTAPPAPPVTITIGTGTTPATNYPYNTYWHDNRTQILYTAAEIDALGGAAGNITTFGLNVSTNATQLMNGFNIRMANSPLTALTGFEAPTWTTVYSTPLSIASTGWQNITLTTPFAWNGTDNILVEICFDNSSYTSASGVLTSTTSFVSVVTKYQDNGTGCALTGPSTYTARPNVRLTLPPKAGTIQGTVTSSYSGAPLPAATITVGANPPVAVYSSGMYIINMGVGTYQVTANCPGYLPKTKTVNVAQNITSTLNFALDPIPAIISGIVTNAATGAPVNGAKVSFGTASTYSIADGSYSLAIYPGGTAGTVSVSKPGFITQTTSSITPTPPTSYTQNVALLEDVNPAGAVTAALNSGQTAVNLSWGLPVGQYMLIYDDGVAENFAVWATADNMNATKFTPVGYPAQVLGGSINIGKVDNYAAGANPLVPFKVAIYDAAGPGGTPGAELVAPFTVTPTALGFVDFTLASPLTINSGNFYIVMIQGGNAPNAAGVAIDTTTQQLRSYSKFGSGPWIPGSGNFMMRAKMSGSGGPLLGDNANSNTITASAVPGLIYQHTPATVTGIEGVGQVVYEGGDSPESITGYQVFRLKQGEEGNSALWTSIGTPTATSMVDPAWPSLACGPYRWAVQAIYTGNRIATPVFSNVIGKCWTANVTVNVDLSCDSVTPAGTKVVLQNLALTDTVYTKYADASGVVLFNNVWKGNYKVTISKFDYIDNVIASQVVMGDVTIGPVVLLQVKAAPTAMSVDDRTLWATWNAPQYQVPIFTETFASGSFTTNQWVVAGGTNWSISTSVGQPAPSARFYYSPAVTNYSQTLTSKTLAGVNSPVMKVQYDLYLDNYGNTTLEQMAVELWDGTAWHTIANHDNSSGADIVWTTFQADATPYANAAQFKIRFRAYGEDSNNIDNWYIDNIKVLAMQPDGVDPCMLAYNLYLNNVAIATLPPTQTTYRIPPSVVHYGTTYNACVLAVYGSGYSTTSCDMFTSHFLYPPKNIAAQGIEDAAYITWDKPVVSDDAMAYNSFVSTPVAGAAADVASAPSTFVSTVNVPLNNSDATYGNGNLVNSPGTGTGGADESLIEAPGNNYGFGAQIVAASNSVADDFVVPAGGWNCSKFTFYSYQTGASTAGTITGCMFRIWNGAPNAGGTVVWGDMTTNKMTSQTFSNVYRVQNVGGGVDRAIIKVECNVTGLNLPAGTYWVEFGLTGSLSSGPWVPPVVGTTPNTPNAMQNQAGSWATLNDNGVPRELPFQIEHDGAGGGGAAPDGLIGYNVYRDDAFRHFVADPDTLFYYDMHLEPGTYCYDVTAKYDLAAYGFAGQFDESLVASNGPACVDIIYGRALPFYEPWDGGNFSFNDWTTVGGNWSVNNGLGNPAPSADFSWQPIVHNYNQTIETPILNAGSFSCANIWLDFDLKLADRNSTGDEKIIVDIYSAGTWTTKAEFANTASIPWTAQHIDLKQYAGKAFKVRFTATGVNSDDILHWYVDNINVYGICKAPGFAPANVTQSQFTTTLTWTAPVCEIPTQLVKLFQWDGTPDNGYYQNYDYAYGVVYDLTTYPDAVLKKIDFHHASWGTIGTWQYKIHVVDWDSYTEVATLGPLTTTGNDIWENDILLGDVQGMGGHNVGIMLEPMSNSSTDAYPCFSADNVGPDGVSVFGALPDYSSFGTSSIGDFLQNLWIEVPLEDGAVTFVPNKINVSNLPNNAQTRVAGPAANTNGFLMTNQNAYLAQSNADSSHVMGYNVYRTDGTGTGAFTKLNAAPVTALTYADVHPSTTEPGQTFKYYITALFEDSMNPGPVICEPSSDTVEVHWPAVGINDLTNNGIRLFPNPASTFVNVEATSAINSVEVINFIGQTVYTVKSVAAKTMKLNVQNYPAGVYFVKVTTTTGTVTTKITVTR